MGWEEDGGGERDGVGTNWVLILFYFFVSFLGREEDGGDVGMGGDGWRVAGKWNGKESGWGGRWEGGSWDAEKRERRERGGERERDII